MTDRKTSRLDANREEPQENPPAAGAPWRRHYEPPRIQLRRAVSFATLFSCGNDPGNNTSGC